MHKPATQPDASLESENPPGLHKLYRYVKLLFDPIGYARDEEQLAYNEIEKRLEFFLLQAINKSPGAEVDTVNRFTDAERQRYFGKTTLGMEDISWTKFEEILCPKAMPGAVFRVNGSLEGSCINDHWSKVDVHGSDDEASIAIVKHMPRTITIYNNEEHAKVAAKLLRILTQGSGAVIHAEPIIRGMAEPLWVVSDNMDLQTHNALRLIHMHLSRKMPEQERQRLRESVQCEVNKRLPKDEHWDALEGVSTFLTLAGRPGVKLYKKRADGKDDPKDKENLEEIPEQSLPLYVRGVPHKTVYAKDGRRYMEPGNVKAIIGHLLLGPNGYAIVCGDSHAIGDIIRDNAKDMAKDFSNPSVAIKGSAAIDFIKDDLGEKLQNILGTTAMVVAVGSGMLVCAVTYQSVKKIGSKLGQDWDPIEHRLKPYVIRKAGDPNMPHFHLEHEERQSNRAVEVTEEEVKTILGTGTNHSLQTPLGEIVLPHHSRQKWRQTVTGDIADRFCNYMNENGLWPTFKTLAGNNPPIEYEDSGQFIAARTVLATSYARWVAEALRRRETGGYPTHGNGHHSLLLTATEPCSEALAGDINDFVHTVQHNHTLDESTANHIVEKTREALRNSMKIFLLKGQIRASAESPLAGDRHQGHLR